jgi:ADP-ribose pyrophosphatase
MAATVVYAGKKFSVAIEEVAWPDGRTTLKEIVQHNGAVVILPFSAPETLVMVRAYRPAVRQTLLELPAGTIEPGEDPDATAARELAEETGYRARCWRKLREFLPSPGILSEVMHLYLATDLEPGRQALDEGEHVEPVLVPWTQALRHCLDGTIRDGKTLVGILLWDRIRPGA